MSGFDKNRFFLNLSILVKEKGKKLGELEKDAGVSTGYLSRVRKEGSNNPSLEVVVALASLLGVSVDKLIYGDLFEPTATENYLLTFIHKLTADTNAGDLLWGKQNKLSFMPLTLDAREELEAHPLMLASDDEDDRGVCYNSSFHGLREKARVVDDCFCADIGGGDAFFLMCIGVKSDPDNINSQLTREYELYYVNNYNQRNGICHAVCDPTDIFYLALQQLYDAATEQGCHAQVNPDVRRIIDWYMTKDTVEQGAIDSSTGSYIDDDGELPF